MNEITIYIYVDPSPNNNKYFFAFPLKLEIDNRLIGTINIKDLNKKEIMIEILNQIVNYVKGSLFIATSLLNEKAYQKETIEQQVHRIADECIEFKELLNSGKEVNMRNTKDIFLKRCLTPHNI